MSVPVKEERQDEAEIQEMALKMAEAHRQKMLAAPRNTAPMANQVPGMNILNYFNRAPKAKGSEPTPQSTPPASEPQNSIDEESYQGHFGWFKLDNVDVPYIMRSKERYVSVRMLELKVLQQYLSFLHQDVYNCTCIRSYYITDQEARLLNEINIKHCDSQFGRDPFTNQDLIVRLTDAVEFYNFLGVCYMKLTKGSTTPLGRCGFIRINKESVVPYTVYNLQKYVPLFYFEGETENLKMKANKLEGWDLSYLKFCCKVQGIRNELFAHDTCAVISLNDIRNYFPPGTLFEDYWPTKVVDSHLLINNRNLPPAGQWTRQPPGPPVAPSRPPPSPKPAIQAKAAMNSHHHNMQNAYANFGIGGQPGYPNLQPRTATSAVRPAYPSTAATSRVHSRPPYYNLNQTPAPPPLLRPNQQ